MQLTDQELCMLEQLTYLNTDVAKAAGIDGDQFRGGIHEDYEGMTVGEILNCFQPYADTKGNIVKPLKILQDSGIRTLGSSLASAAEWANIIQYLMDNERISGLLLNETMKSSAGIILALCFGETEEALDAIVAFKGTSGAGEWIDNIEGLNEVETESQKEALDFIASLRYPNITVTGHSKGGNKAMYVALRSDQVTRCVSFDAQGFSSYFLQEYGTEIQRKGSCIICYALSTDYVHALLLPIPNAKQIYCLGYDDGGAVKEWKQHHCPNSFFVTDEKGKLMIDAEGNPTFQVTSEAPSIRMLHKFTVFVMEHAEGRDLNTIVSYLSKAISMNFSGSSSDELIGYLLSKEHTDVLALVIAYLVKYMDTDHLGTEDIDKLLECLGLNYLNQMIKIKDFSLFGSEYSAYVNLARIISYIQFQLVNGSDRSSELSADFFELLQNIFAKDIKVDVKALWMKVYEVIPKISSKSGIQNT